MGTFARLSDRGDVVGVRGCYRIALVAVLLTAGPIAGFGYIQREESERLIASVTGLYAGLALFLLLRRSAMVCCPALLWLGLISYSLYLVHPLVLDLIVHVTLQLSSGWQVVITVTAVPAGAILFAAALQRFVEQPANRLGKCVRTWATAS